MKYEKFPFRRIRDLREDADLTQKQVAAYLNISPNTYFRYEHGLRMIPLDLLIRLADLYRTSMDYLLELSDDPTPYPPPAP